MVSPPVKISLLEHFCIVRIYLVLSKLLSLCVNGSSVPALLHSDSGQVLLPGDWKNKVSPNHRDVLLG